MTRDLTLSILDDTPKEGAAAREMTMAEIDENLLRLIRQVETVTANQGSISTDLSELKREISEFRGGLDKFYRDEGGWPRVARLETKLALLERGMESLEGALDKVAPEAPSRLPTQVRQGIVPAGLSTAGIGAAWLLYQGLSWLGSWVN